MVENCFVPNGTLYIRYNYHNKTITLARCCLLQPFVEMTVEEFLKIDDILGYAKSFNYGEPKFWPGSEDRCPTCNFPKDRIFQVCVGLSYACNLRCHNCFYEGHHKDDPQLLEMYFNILNKLKGSQLNSIQLTDVGEPFFYYRRTIDYLKSLSLNDTLSVNFLTNGNLLSKERVDELYQISQDTNINYSFVVSIDGVTKESYEKTRINGNFERVIENTVYLNEVFGASINFTIRKPNMGDVLNIKPFFKSLGFTKVDIYYDIYDEECKKLYYQHEDLLKKQAI